MPPVLSPDVYLARCGREFRCPGALSLVRSPDPTSPGEPDGGPLTDSTAPPLSDPQQRNQKLLESRTQLLVKARALLHEEVGRRHQAELRAALESALTRVLTSSATFEESLPNLVKALCLGARWDAGEFWVLDAEAQALRWGGWFAKDPAPFQAIITSSQGGILPSGKGLPWRVWTKGQPLAGHPVGEELGPTRATAFRKAGLKAGLSLPFHGGEGTGGIMILYRKEEGAQAPEETDYLVRLLRQLARLGAWKWGEGAQQLLEARVRGFVEGYPLPSVVCDAHGRIRFVSEAASKLLGDKTISAVQTVKELPAALPLFVAGTDEPYPADRLPFLRALSGEPAYADDLEVRRDGRSVFLEAWAAPLKAPAGTAEYSIGVIQNTTAARRQRQELEQAREAAQTADRAKSDFVSRMSHEIRTPLNAILGSVDLLWETPLTQEQQEYVRLCRDAGQGLMGLISNVLDLSRVEEGKLELAETPFSLEDLLDRTIELVSLRAHQKGLEVSSYVDPGVPERMVGDPVRLRQILVNLLGNALKFTEKGHISVRVQREPGDEDPGHLLFTVEDTGIGIPAERLDAVFERFVQASVSTAAEYGGSGLGLTISKHLVEMMGGKISVQSVIGQGSTFTFTLHLKVAEGSPVRQVRPVLKGVRVLIADGAEQDRQLLHQILEEEATKLSLAESGQEALAELERARAAGAPYQLVLLADRLSDGSAAKVARYLSEQGAAGQVLFLSSAGQAAENAPRLRELGITNQVTKPIDRGALLAAAATTLRASKVLPKAPPRRVARTPASETPNLAGLRILVAEDTEDNRFLMQRFLRNTACRMDMAENGKVALDKFTMGKYDVVLMDLQMPFMDGFAATKSIREWEKKKGVAPTPIIALSAYAIKEEVERSLAAGCDAHITKPIDKAKLFEILGNFAKKASA